MISLYIPRSDIDVSYCSSIFNFLRNLHIVFHNVVAAAKSLQSCLTLCNPIDASPLGSPVPGILQARTLEWVAISFSSEWKWSRSVMSDSSQPHGVQPTRLLCPWDFPGKSTWVGCHCLLLPFPTEGIFHNSGIKPVSCIGRLVLYHLFLSPGKQL